MTNRAAESQVNETQTELSANKNESTQWQTQLAADCWSQNQSGSSSNNNEVMSLASAKSGDWLEDRAAQRIKELASQYGLDPDKASMKDVIEARATKGNQENEGRVERLRQAEANKYGLDPEKADWTAINIARVEARKRELGMN